MKKNEKKETKTKSKKGISARQKSLSYCYPIAECKEDALRFDETIVSWIRASGNGGNNGPRIGVLQEKSLHSILKRFISQDEQTHEIPIVGRNTDGKHGYIADVCVGEQIYEIQTGGFYPLIPKITYYLNETDYDITVIHPIPFVRYKVWIEPETGEIKNRRRSPRRGRAEDALRELFWIREMLSSPRLHVLLLFLEEEEYRYLDGWSCDKKRGSNRCERVPISLLGRVDLMSRDDYAAFLPPVLPEEFTASDLGAVLHLRGRAIYSALKLFLSLGFLEQSGVRGRSTLYRRVVIEK